jgi:hypothetical protein
MHPFKAALGDKSLSKTGRPDFRLNIALDKGTRSIKTGR